MPNENSEGFVVEAKAKIDQSFNNLLMMMQSMANTGLDLTSSLSESASALAGFAQQATNATYQLEKLARAKYSMRAQVMLVTGVFTGAATAIYKFVKSTAEAEMGLAKLAKQQKQTVETARASQTALETMGKTLKEVKSDKELKKTYDELVKINAEMALPKMDRAIENVKGLRNAFWQLRDTAKYAIDWIGARVLMNLEEPIKRITGKFSEVAKWLRFNLDSVTMKISSGITAFVKGIEGLVEGFGKVIDLISQIDPNIRKIGGAILFVLGLLKSGPIGMILSVLTAIGGIIDDAENFKYNQHYGLTKENPTGVDEKGRPIQYVDTAFTGIWEIMFGKGSDEKSGQEKFESVFNLLFDSLNTKLEELSNSLKEFDLFKSLFGEDDEAGEKLNGWLDKLNEFLTTQETKDRITKLFSNIINVLKEGLQAGGNLVSDLVAAFTGLFNDGEGGFWTELTKWLDDSPTATGLGSAALLKLFGFDDGKVLVGGILSGITDAYDKAKEAVEKEGKLKEGDKGFAEAVLNQLIDGFVGKGGELEKIASLITEAVTAAFETVRTAGDVTSGVLTGIIKGIFNLGPESDAKKVAEEVVGEITETGFFKAAANGIAAKMIGGDGAGLIATISSLIAEYATPEKIGALEEDFNKIKDAISTLWYGVWDHDYDSPTYGKRKGGLESVLAPLWNDITSGVSGWFDSIWNGADGKSGLHKTLTDLKDNIWTGVSEWWNGKEWDEGEGRDRMHHEKKGFRQRLAEMIFGDDGSIDPLGIVSGFKEWWNKSGVGNAINGAIEDLLNGPADEHGNRSGGLKRFFLGGTDENGEEVLGWFEQIFQSIVTLAETYGSLVWQAFFNALPKWAQDLISPVLGDPNSSAPERDNEGNVVSDNGKVKIKSSNNTEYEVSQQDYEDFGKLFQYMYKNENGGWNYSGPLAKAHDDMLNTGLFSMFEHYLNNPNSGINRDAIIQGFSDIFAPGKYEGFEFGNKKRTSLISGAEAEEPESVEISGDTEKFDGVIAEVKEEYDKTKNDIEEALIEIDGDPKKLLETAEAAKGKIEEMQPEMSITGDAQSAISAAQKAVARINSMSATISVGASISFNASGGKTGGFLSKFTAKKAWGGRIDQETNGLTVGEDGTEYIIPITKPSRAAELIKQMFGEMGTSSVQKIVEDLGLGMSGNTIGSDYASIASAMGGSSNITTNNNVSAPVNIYVSASGVGAEDVGARAYDAAQRQHLRMLKGVFA